MSISRRKFLGGVAAGASVLVPKAAKAGDKSFAGYPGRYGLLHDTTLCVGCRSCEAACNEVNHLPAPQESFDDLTVLKQTRRSTEKAYTVVNRYPADAKAGEPTAFRKLQCMHCNEPCCVSVCLVKAFEKTPEGPVLYNPDVCLGCRYCVMACPYRALAYEYEEPLTPRVMRCTMCYDRIKEGLNPGCADACPQGAITYGRRADLIKVARERIHKYPERYIDHVFGEHEYGGTSWMLLAGIPFAKLGLPEGTSHTPLPELTKGVLGTVPLVLTMWPGLLLGIYAFRMRREKISQQELESEIAATLAQADTETKEKLAAAAKKAKTAQERAVAQAIKKALAEAEAAAKKATEEKEATP